MFDSFLSLLAVITKILQIFPVSSFEKNWSPMNDINLPIRSITCGNDLMDFRVVGYMKYTSVVKGCLWLLMSWVTGSATTTRSQKHIYAFLPAKTWDQHRKIATATLKTHTYKTQMSQMYIWLYAYIPEIFVTVPNNKPTNPAPPFRLCRVSPMDPRESLGAPPSSAHATGLEGLGPCLARKTWPKVGWQSFWGTIHENWCFVPTTLKNMFLPDWCFLKWGC